MAAYVMLHLKILMKAYQMTIRIPLLFPHEFFNSCLSIFLNLAKMSFAQDWDMGVKVES
jgi:hypothetical protein